MLSLDVTLALLQTKGLDGVCPTSNGYRHSRCDDALATGCGNGSCHQSSKSLLCTGDEGDKHVAVGRACDPVHSRAACLAYFANPALGSILSLALPSHMGVGFLFLCSQLLNRGLWGHHSSPSLEGPWPNGERRRRHYVWHVGKRSVRDCDPTDRKRASRVFDP